MAAAAAATAATATAATGAPPAGGDGGDGAPEEAPVRSLGEVAAASVAAAAAARAAPGAVLSTFAGAEGVEVQLRQYGGEVELPHIMEMIAKDLSEPYSVYTYRFFASTWPHLCMSAYVEGRLVGVILCRDEIKKGRLRGYVAMLVVEKPYRKHGIGSKLAAAAVAKMAEYCDEVVLEAEECNTSALRLYERLGFVRDKRLPKYYMNGSDAYRLVCHFN